MPRNLEKQKLTNKRYRERHKAKIKAKHVKYNNDRSARFKQMGDDELLSFIMNKICSTCTTPLTLENTALYWLPHNLRCKDCANKDGRNRRLKLKIEVLKHYGYKCKCGEDRWEVLSLDHIENGGEAHRRELNIKSGHHFYLWIKRNNFPPGFQTMCMNCQFIKAKDALIVSMKTDAIRARRRKLKLRLEILTHYGHGIIECRNCHMNNLKCLSLDHINGGGRRHRQLVGDIYQYLRNTNCVDNGYQILCMNCQFMKQLTTH